MNWINRVMLKFIQFYLSIVFLTAVTFFTFLRKMLGKSPIKVGRKKEPPSYWIKRGARGASGSRTPLFVSHTRGKSVLGESIRTFFKEGKYDYAIILMLLLPVKMFLRVDKSTEVDPSIYVMY